VTRRGVSKSPRAKDNRRTVVGRVRENGEEKKKSFGRGK